MFDGNLRSTVDRAVQPIGRGLHRAGITPDLLTATGLLMSVATAVVIGAGHPRWGLVVFVLSALPDLLDGAVAKASGRSSMRGAIFDSVADRVTDAFLLGGIAWYLGSEHGFTASMLAFAVLGASSLISYQRAKAEIYGLDAKGGLMERAERLIALGIALAFPSLLIPVLAIMLVLVSITALQRFVKVWRQADAPAITSARRASMASLRAERAAVRRAARSARVERTRTVAERMERWRIDRRTAADARARRRDDRASH